MKIGAGSANRSESQLLLPLEHLVHRAFVERDGVVVHVKLDVLGGDRRVQFLRVFPDVCGARIGVCERVFNARAERTVDTGPVQCRQDRGGWRSPPAATGSSCDSSQIAPRSAISVSPFAFVRKSPFVDQHAAIRRRRAAQRLRSDRIASAPFQNVQADGAEALRSCVRLVSRRARRYGRVRVPRRLAPRQTQPLHRRAAAHTDRVSGRRRRLRSS